MASHVLARKFLWDWSLAVFGRSLEKEEVFPDLNDAGSIGETDP